MWRILVLSVLSFATVACQARIDTHGFMPDRTLIDQIEAGKQNRQTVAQILGSPSTISTFDANIWYYITQQTKNYAFFKPEIIDRPCWWWRLTTAGQSPRSVNILSRTA